MSVYKYVKPGAALRYLEAWSLRITPPDQFNDPFELKPVLKLLPDSLRGTAPLAMYETVARELRGWVAREQGIPPGPAQEATVDKLANLILGRMAKEEELAFLHAYPIEVRESVLALKAHTLSAAEKILTEADATLPEYSLMAQRLIHAEFGKHFGVLCLTRAQKNLLMWGHYTEDHKGALLEFDGSHACFKRTLGESTELGRLFPVHYADERPTVTAGPDEDTFACLALTKALPWSYEQELRLLWPLVRADQAVEPEPGTRIHLMSVPPAALRGVVFGCRATSEFTRQAARLLELGAARHVKLRRSVLDDHAFDLKYVIEP